MRKRYFIVLLMLCSFGASAQLETSADFRRQVYDREYTLGLIGHTRGYSINGRYLKFLDGFNKRGLEIDMAKLRHPKEVRSPSDNAGSSRGYVFNRINSFYTLRAGYIHENVMFDKTDKGTVSISLITSGGLSLGLLKPVYIQVFDFDAGSLAEELTMARYNPLEHNQSSIRGEANFFRGVGETSLRPGIYAKVGANFDYQLIEKKVTAIETGLVYDYFFREVPIFFEEPEGEDINYTGFFQIYIAVNFGYRKN